MKKAGLLCLIIMTVLLAVGVGYAGWVDTVTLIEDLNTGLLSVGIRNNGLMYCHSSMFSGSPQGSESGNAFSLNCTDGAYLFELHGQPYYDKVHVTVFTHPRFNPFCYLEIANGGTLPASIEGINVHLGSRVRVGGWEMTLPGGYRESGRGLGSLQAAIRKTLEPEQIIALKMELCSNSKHPGIAAGNISIAYNHFNGAVPGGNVKRYFLPDESDLWTPTNMPSIIENPTEAVDPQPGQIPAASGSEPELQQSAETEVPAGNPPLTQESHETPVSGDIQAEITESSETPATDETSLSSDATQPPGDEAESSSPSGADASESTETSSPEAASPDASGSAGTTVE